MGERGASRTQVFLASFVLALAAAGPAHALVITPTFDSSITSDPNAAGIEGVINTAISFYESTFSDPITVGIQFSEGGGLGSSTTGFYNVSYQTYINALIADAKTSNDATALALLSSIANNPVN